MKNLKFILSLVVVLFAINTGVSQSITTLFAANNGGSLGGAVYFDATVGPSDIDITAFDVNTADAGSISMDVYTIPGTSVGNETNMAAWTMVASGTGTAAGLNNPSNVTLGSSFTLSASTSYGIALVFTSSHGHDYTNGNGANQNFSNADITLDLGQASNVPFTGGIFSPRVWNGTIYYSAGPPPPSGITHPSSGTENFTVICGETTEYYDSGGPDCDGTGGEYSSNESGVAVICPDIPGSFVTIDFLDVDIETRTSTPCWDFLNIYDGNSTSATQLFSGCGEEGFDMCSGFAGDGGDGGGVEGGPNDINASASMSPANANNVWTSSDATGCLTVEFTSDSSVDEGGWVAEITCEAIDPPTCMPFSLDGAYCDPCVTPGMNFALACSVGPNAIISPIDVSGIVGTATLGSIDFNQDSQGTNPGSVTLNLYCGPAGGPAPYSPAFTPFYSEVFPVFTADDGTCVNLPLTTPQSIDASCGSMWVELIVQTGRVVHTPQTCNGNSGNGTQGWLNAPACGLSPPVRFDAIGFAFIDVSYSANFTCDIDCSVDGPTLNVSSCMCGFDPNIGNIGSLVEYSVSGGTGPYTITTSNGTLEEDMPLEDFNYNLYLGVTGGSYTLTVTDANGCSSEVSGTCTDCFFEPAMITDPCSCNNDQSYNGAEDGTFTEIVEIMGPPGINLIVGAGSTGLNVPVGTPIPQVTPFGLYRLIFTHTDRTGYTLLVEGQANGQTFPILDAAGNQLTTTNTCQYPVITEPDVAMVDFCFNGGTFQFSGDEIEEINGFSGSTQIYVGSQTFGDLITEFDPTQYPPGIYELTFVFTGDFVDDMGTPADPGFPGCQTSTSILIGIGGGGNLSCSDHVNISVNNDCEVDFSWYTLMEDDAIPNVFTGIFMDSAGNIIDESSLGDFVGRTLTYSIEDLCTGNSCWGTMTIEDKSIPTVACDCPVGGEDLDGDGFIDGYSEDCTLSCYELPLLKDKYWDNLRDDLVPEDVGDFIDDNVTSVCDDVTEDQVSYYDVYEDLGCEGALLRRTWTVTYDKGNGVAGTVSCTREYFFQPVGLETLDTARIDPVTGLPVIVEDSLLLPFPLVELDCGADISPAGIAAFFDNPASTDEDTDDDGIDPDELDIDVVVESNEGIPYAYPHYYIQGRNPSGPHPQAINTEVCNILVAYVDQEIEACAPGCAGNRKILRNWTVLDWCEGEFVQYGQIIKAVDQTGPIIDVRDISVSVDPWKCSADVRLPAPEHLSDGCDGELSYWIGAVEGGLSIGGNAEDGFILIDAGLGTWSVEYVTADCCGNQARATIQVTVVDLTPPVPVTKEFIVLSLTNIGNSEDEEQGIAKLFAEDVDNGSYDGCTDVTVEVRRTEVHCEEFDADTLWSDHVKFCCSDLEGQAFVEIDVHFRVTDENGNVNYAWATVRLEDKSSPTQVCPPDMVLTCDMDYNDFTMTGLPQMFSACGEIDLMCDPDELIEDTEPRRKGPNDGFFNNPLYDGVEVPAYDPSCGFGAVRRQFRSCSSCVQWFVIEPIDAFDATTIVWPNDQVLDCDDYEIEEPTWEESVCNLVGVTMDADTFLFEDGACYKILNHWSIINWCIYDAANPTGPGRYDYTQVIKIIDTQDPVMTVEDSLCFAVDENCLSQNVQLSASAVDEGDCGSEWLKWEVTIDLYADWNMDYFYGTSLPRLVNGVTNPYHIAPTGNGESATITLPDGLESSKIWHRAVWRVYDGCGNNMSHVRYFQITDKKAPTPYCLNLSTAVMSGSGTVELWAIDFNVGSFDNCTDSDNLLFTFTDVAPPPRDDSEYDSSSDLEWYNGTFWYYNSETGEYEDQDDYGDEVHRWEPGLRSAGKIFTTADADASGFAQIPIYVWDECGNVDFCLVNLRLIDNMGVGEGRISGQVITEEGEEVEGVMTELMSNAPEYPEYNMTNANGEYAFNEVQFSLDYTVSGSSTDNYINGVSTLDLLLIQKHILGTEALDSPYKMIAADANSDNEITAIDLIDLRKLILGIYTELPNNVSWKAVDATQTLSVMNPWIYTEELSINDLQTNMTNEDFIGVKIGDVNNSATAHVRNTETVQSGSAIELTYIDRQVKEGEIVELEVRSNTEASIYGYQFTMATEGLELVEVKGENLDNNKIGVFKNKLTMSNNGLEPMNGEALFTLIFKAERNGLLSEIINVNSSVTKAEAYVGEDLKVVDIAVRSEGEAGKFALYQNQPNPFSEYTVIGYEVPQSGAATISLYDVTGKILKVIETEATKGYNEVRVDRSDLDMNGLIYYQLQTNEHTATQHMLMIE